MTGDEIVDDIHGDGGSTDQERYPNGRTRDPGADRLRAVSGETSGPDAASRWRLFVALPVPPTAGAALAEALGPYRRAFADARWLRPELLHVTVRFLGWLPEAVVAELALAVSETAAHGDAIELATGAGGGNGRGAVAWLGVTTGGEAVRRSRGILDERLPAAARAAIDPRVPPSAHVTVARRASRELVHALRAQALGPTTVAWTADRLVLFRSFTGTPEGSRYEPVAEASLGARTAG